LFLEKTERSCALVNETYTFLTEVELPQYCFFSEAIEWIAFGRVPQMQYHADGSEDAPIDYRFYWSEMPDNFQPSFEYFWFDRLEFESLGIPINDKYFPAAEQCAFENVHGLPKQIADYEAKEPSFIEQEDGSELNLWEKLETDARRKLAELGPFQSLVDEVERGFKPHADIAWAKLFQLLATGRIQSEAINFDRWEKCVEEDMYEEAARFDVVPPLSYSLGFSWAQNEIEIDGVRNVALRVRAKDILENRAHLLQIGKSVSVERFGAFYLSSNAARSNFKRKRGRPNEVNWQRVKEKLALMVTDGSTPSGKESCIYELIIFAENELDKTPSRTAVQRNLHAELDAIYAQK